MVSPKLKKQYAQTKRATGSLQGEGVVLTDAGNQAALAGAIPQQNAEVDEVERRRWIEAMGWGREFDKLSPKEQIELNTSLRNRGLTPHPSDWPTQAVACEEDNDSWSTRISNEAVEFIKGYVRTKIQEEIGSTKGVVTQITEVVDTGFSIGSTFSD